MPQIQSDINQNTSKQYRAPEQIDLKSGYPLGLAVDIFALGIIMYSMMYFKLPFKDGD